MKCLTCGAVLYLVTIVNGRRFPNHCKHCVALWGTSPPLGVGGSS